MKYTWCSQQLTKLFVLLLCFFVLSAQGQVLAAGEQQPTQESVKSEAQTYGTPFGYSDGIITDYDSQVSLDPKGNATITETITVYFPNEKHGIFRWIPNEVIVNGKKLAQPIKVKSLEYRKLPSSSNLAEKISAKYSYTTSKSSGNYTVLKIGDADEYISGAYKYTISYTMKRAVRFQNGYNELYLNITGDQWEIPILKASARVSPHANSSEQKCFTGARGSTTSICSITVDNVGFVFKTTSPATTLAQGLTVALKYPDQTFTPPTDTERFIEAFLPLTPLLIPLVVFFYAFVVWRKYGKDISIRAIPPIVVPTKQMETESLSIQNSLLSMKSLPLATLAELIRLAEKGYLTISYENNKVRLLLSEEQIVSIQAYLETQPASLQKLVSVLTSNFQPETTLSELKSVYTAIAEANKLASTEFQDTPYITDYSESMQKKFIGLGIVGFVGGAGMFMLFNENITYSWVFLPISLILCGVIFIIFAIGMLKRTKEGDLLTRDLLGLKKYIKAAEVRRLEFFNNPKKMIAHFEQILPYAVILKLDKQWTKEFGPVLEQLQYQPTWMTSDIPIYHALPRTYAAMSSQVSANMATISTPPQSSGSSFSGGGGFSGGGSGGGGGGSW